MNINADTQMLDKFQTGISTQIEQMKKNTEENA